MREEQRSAVIEAEWQGDIEVGFAIFEVVTGGPSFVIDFGIDGEAGVGGSQNVGDEAFVPALNFVVLYCLYFYWFLVLQLLKNYLLINHWQNLVVSCYSICQPLIAKPLAKELNDQHQALMNQ